MRCLHGKAHGQHTQTRGTQQRRPHVVLAQARGFGKPKTLISDRELLQPRPVSPRLPVPAHIPKPTWADTGKQPPFSAEYSIHDEKGIQKMRASGKLAAQVLDYACSLAKPGVTTDAIDKAVHEMIIANNAYPSPLNYGKFPKSVCTSINECVCHGIPDDRPLQSGDIMNIDVTVYLDGYHGDTSRMVLVGAVTPEAKKLCEVTELSLMEAIKICKPGVPFKEIGRVINAIADKHRYGVVKDFAGHGVGKMFHTGPTINHARNNEPGVMQLWQTFTIEPMLVQGKPAVKFWDDKWTAVTKDGSLAAQYEHTILITPDGAEILTKLE